MKEVGNAFITFVVSFDGSYSDAGFPMIVSKREWEERERINESLNKATR